MKVNTKARQIIQKVRDELGYTFEEISEECGVSIGSVQRWYSKGRAKQNKIKFLEDLLSNIRLSETKIADILIEIYRDKKKPIYLSRKQFLNISGRVRLSPKVILKVQEKIDEKGFLLIEELDKDEQTVFIILRRKWCLKKANRVDEVDLEDYYYRKSEIEIEIEEEEDEDEDE